MFSVLNIMLLCITLLWKFAYKSKLCGHNFSFLLDIQLRVKLLGQMISLLNFLRKCQIVIQNGYSTLQSCKQYMRVSVYLHPPQLLLFSVFHVYFHNYFWLTSSWVLGLGGTVCIFYYNHLYVCTDISLWFSLHFPNTNFVNHLFMGFEIFIYPCWWNISSNILPVFNCPF